MTSGVGHFLVASKLEDDKRGLETVSRHPVSKEDWSCGGRMRCRDLSGRGSFLALQNGYAQGVPTDTQNRRSVGVGARQCCLVRGRWLSSQPRPPAGQRPLHRSGQSQPTPAPGHRPWLEARTGLGPVSTPSVKSPRPSAAGRSPTLWVHLVVLFLQHWTRTQGLARAGRCFPLSCIRPSGCVSPPLLAAPHRHQEKRLVGRSP